jgi:hypothetical protein
MRSSNVITIERRDVLRAVVVAVAATLIALWVRFGYVVFTTAQNRPAPAAIMLPVFFCVVALGAALAALQGDAIKIAIAGGISLLPTGLFLLLFPGTARFIPLLDVALIALGVALMRSERPTP